jgi:hypothetical protein
MADTRGYFKPYLNIYYLNKAAFLNMAARALSVNLTCYYIGFAATAILNLRQYGGYAR